MRDTDKYFTHSINLYNKISRKQKAEQLYVPIFNKLECKKNVIVKVTKMKTISLFLTSDAGVGIVADNRLL